MKTKNYLTTSIVIAFAAIAVAMYAAEGFLNEMPWFRIVPIVLSVLMIAIASGFLGAFLHSKNKPS